MNGAQHTLTIRVWDLSTRAMHWLIVSLFGLSWWSGEVELLMVHRISGYLMLTVLLLRVYWGFAGSETARFSSFVRGPRAVLAYLDALFDKHAAPDLGHNPVGGWFTVLFVVVLLLQCVLGFGAVPMEGTGGGPVSRYLSFELARDVAALHERLFNLVLMLAAIHVSAIAFYWLVKRQNLLLPMITGDKVVSEDTRGPVLVRPSRAALAAVVLGLIVAIYLLEGP